MGIENVEKQEYSDKKNKDISEYKPQKIHKEDLTDNDIAELESKIDQVYQKLEIPKLTNTESQVVFLKNQHEYIIDRYDTMVNKHLPNHNISKITPNKIHTILTKGTTEEIKSLSRDFIEPVLVDIYRSVRGQFAMRGLSSLFLKPSPSKDMIALQEYYVDINNLIKNISGSDQ